MTNAVRVALAAALLSGAAATAASAEPDPPHGGPCHVYWNDPALAHNLPLLPQPPGTPYVICDR